MLLALVLFILPAVMIVILGPAIIQIFQMIMGALLSLAPALFGADADYCAGAAISTFKGCKDNNISPTTD